MTLLLLLTMYAMSFHWTISGIEIKHYRYSIIYCGRFSHCALVFFFEGERTYTFLQVVSYEPWPWLNTQLSKLKTAVIYRYFELYANDDQSVWPQRGITYAWARWSPRQRIASLWYVPRPGIYRRASSHTARNSMTSASAYQWNKWSWKTRKWVDSKCFC